MQINYTLNNNDYLLNNIKLKDFKELQLYIQLQDNKQILKYFNFLLNNVTNLNVFEQTKLLLYDLIITTRNVYEFSLNNDKNKCKYSIKIEDIINNIDKININDYIIQVNENISIKIGIPNEFFLYNEKKLQQDLLNYNTYKYIKQIIIDNEEVPLLPEIIDQLPSNILTKISSKIKEYDDILKGIPFFNKEIEANCQIVTLFEFLKKLFTYNYQDLLKKEYILFKYVRICNYYDINLNEANAFLNIYNDDLINQQKEIENSTNASKNVNIIRKNS